MIRIRIRIRNRQSTPPAIPGRHRVAWPRIVSNVVVGTGLALVWAACLSCTTWAQAPQPSASGTVPRVSLGPFPYDLTAESVKTVAGLVRSNANLYCVQLDDGIPWEAALSGAEFDANVKDQWQRHRDSIAPHHEVYLAIAPLAEDRIAWAPAAGGATAPAWARDERRLTPELKSAYARYVLRAVDYFRPNYLNIGVESGDLAAKRPAKWPLFDELFADCAAQVRSRHPNLKIGISFGLPLLQKDQVLGRVSKLIDASDYVGVSFYPYMSEFYAKFGAARLPAPPDEWRKPLAWLAQNVRKPIAICETAYSSEPVSIAAHGLRLGGSRELQSAYVTDLSEIARRDGYLFTVFFLTVDYDALMSKLRRNDETMKLWWRTGFFDRNQREKPAWAAYQKAWADSLPVPGRAKAGRTGPAVAAAKPAASEVREGGVSLGFGSKEELFAAPGADEVVLRAASGRDPAHMRWKYTYRAGEFAWSARNLPPGQGKGSRGLAFAVRSDREGPLLLQVEESDGEAFYVVVRPSKEWTDVKVPWGEFTVDGGKKRNGTLESDRLVRILLADPTGKDQKADGSRYVDLARLGYLGSPTK